MRERERKRRREEEGERIPVAFPPAAYPPPLLPMEPAREGKAVTKERRRHEGREEETAREREERDAGGQGIVCDFVLPLAATSRSHSSISHTRLLRHSAHGR